MPDISKCNGEGCPMKEECYRHTAANSFRQSWIEPPIQPDGTCDMWIEERPAFLGVR